jgi:adenylate cyclase
MFSLAANEPLLSDVQRRWRRESRSAWLRLAALAVLVVNLGLSERELSVGVYAGVVGGYGIATMGALALVTFRRGPSWWATLFVVFDALIVIVLFHEHLFAPGGQLDHDLTAPSLAVGFVLLTHVALRLRPMLVVLFSGLVVLGWLALLGIAVESHVDSEATHALNSFAFLREGALAAAFGFAALVCALLAHDHNVLLKSAVATERLRANLSRFFSPTVLSELQTTGTSLALRRREAAVMFVDLRSFTRLSETIPLEDLTMLLAEFRELVTREVFAHGGMIDKFIGDGVMAAFGQPRTTSDDAGQALECAIHLQRALLKWKVQRLARNQSAPDAGIGLHFGLAIGGVLHSGSHDEFTLVGDAVNVAQRLEQLCKQLNATLVVSEDVLTAANRVDPVNWCWAEDVELAGRVGRKRVAYLVSSQDGQSAYASREKCDEAE